MIRKNPKDDMVNPPGQLVNPIEPNTFFQRPANQAIEDYKAQEATKTAVQEAFDRGYREGYYNGLKTLEQRGYNDFVALDPSSEFDR